MSGRFRADDPQTSVDAAERVDTNVWKERAVAAAEDAGQEGATTREAEAWLRVKFPRMDARWSLSPRWVPLIEAGKIFRTGATRDGLLINYAVSAFPKWMIPTVEDSKKCTKRKKASK